MTCTVINRISKVMPVSALTLPPTLLGGLGGKRRLSRLQGRLWPGLLTALVWARRKEQDCPGAGPAASLRGPRGGDGDAPVTTGREAEP